MFNLAIIFNLIAAAVSLLMGGVIAMQVERGYEGIAWLIFGPMVPYGLICCYAFHLAKQQRTRWYATVFFILVTAAGAAIALHIPHYFLLAHLAGNVALYSAACAMNKSPSANNADLP